MRGSSLLGLSVLLVLAGSVARADLPSAVARGMAGPFEVTVFAQEPLRTGMNEFSVRVEGRERSEPVAVEIETRGMRGAGLAPGPVAVHLHHVGTSEAALTVRGKAGSGELRFEIDVLPPAGLEKYWRSLSIAPIGLLLFALHQWRANSESGGRVVG